jgi:hypothetical protein
LAAANAAATADAETRPMKNQNKDDHYSDEEAARRRDATIPRDDRPAAEAEEGTNGPKKEGG